MCVLLRAALLRCTPLQRPQWHLPDVATPPPRRVLKGEGGAVMKVRLVRLEDGDLLSIAVSHTITGWRWRHPCRLFLHAAGPEMPANVPSSSCAALPVVLHWLARASLHLHLPKLDHNHTITLILPGHICCAADLTRWNQLVGHLVALYRHESGGPEPAPGELLQPSDRTLMSSEHLACILLG